MSDPAKTIKKSRTKKQKKEIKQVIINETFSDDEDEEKQTERPLNELPSLTRYDNNMTEDVKEQEFRNLYNNEASIIPELKKLDQFLKQPKCLNPKPKDPNTNIVNMMCGSSHIVEDPYIPEFFKLLDRCRKLNLKTRIYEVQRLYSGIMIDFDVYQDTLKNQFSESMFNILCKKILSVIIDVVKFTSNSETIHMAITKKPAIKYNDVLKCYKDGFHILIPSIKIKRPVKKLILSKLIDNGILENYLEEIKTAKINYGETDRQYNINDILDKNSAHVPVFFLGSFSKPSNDPYVLKYVFELKFNIKLGDIESTIINIDENRYNLCYELSLNWEDANGLITKKEYEIQDKYASHEIIKTVDVDLPASTEPATYQSVEIRKLLDILSPNRVRNSMRGFDILCILANTSTLYKTEAEYFSKKNPEFKQEVFEKDWMNAVKSNKKRGLTLGSLYYFAKQDNNTEYQKIRQNTIYSVLQSMLMTPYKYGKLSHFDIADLLFILLEHKYFTDIAVGEKENYWYEFMTEHDHHLPGELYKWYKHRKFARNLLIFIVKELPKLFTDNMNKLTDLINESTGDLSKYYASIHKNCAKMVQNLGDVNFTKNILYATEIVFNKRGNADKMDKEVFIRGVHNGILKLSIEPSGKPLLITGYHMHLISKFSTAIYHPFNPYDPDTKKILYALRSLFLDSEPDSHEFTMYWFATTIDGTAKESMIMLVIGGGSNGKTGWAEIHRGATGSNCVSMPIGFLTEKTKNVDNATPNLMQLKDASLAVYSESECHEELNTSRLKLITGLESISARKLHENTINFKPKCHHLVTSNYLFDINCTDFGTWRRICYNPFKITFKDPKHQTYDPNDPTQRIALPEVLKTWAEDQDMQGKYLGIMVWYHYWLYRKYNGAILSVPRPHIEFETKKYERSQNNITEFLNQKCVKTKDPNISYPLTEELEKYIEWYNNKYKVEKIKGLIEQFQNSVIKEFIKNTSRGIMLIGHRFLGKNAIPEPEEEYLFKNVFDMKIPEDNFGIKPESPDEYYERICKEFDMYKDIFNNIPDVADSKNEPNNNPTNIINNKLAAIANEKYQCDDKSKPIYDVHGNRLPDGVQFSQLYEPTIIDKKKKKTNNNYENLISNGYTININPTSDIDLSGFLPENYDQIV